MQVNKYHNIKSEYKGIMYDSRKECKRARDLDILQRGGLIEGLERQKKFVLQEGYVNNKGEKIREIGYFADFYYYDKIKNVWVAEDTKGMRTDVYKIKKKIFEYKFPDILFIES